MFLDAKYLAETFAQFLKDVQKEGIFFELMQLFVGLGTFDCVRNAF